MRVAPVRRRSVAAVLAAVLACLSALSAATPAGAEPFCDRPNPPPICFEDPEPAPDQAPTGAFDALEGGFGEVRVSGWTTDQDAAGATTSVRVRRDGVQVLSITANLWRSDVGAHGFDQPLPAATPGPHTICVAAVNVYGGFPHRPSEVGLGCRTYTAGRHLVGSDQYTGPDTQHATAVESDSYAWGKTVVAAYQVGRSATTMGATNIGFTVSYDAGLTWTSGNVPGITRAESGPHQRASDPVVGYSAKHGAWLIATLPINAAGDGALISRSTDGRTWGAPVWAIGNDGQPWDKEWVVCDNWTSSPHYGTCYLTITNLSLNGRIELARSVDGGQTWVTVPNPSGPSVSPSGNGTAPVVRPDGRLVIPYGVNGWYSVFTIDGAGTTWSTPRSLHHGLSRNVDMLRDVAVISADVDSTGRVYATWHGCLASSPPCQYNDVLFSSSTDGLTWGPPTVVPINCPDQGLCSTSDRFAPSIAVDPRQPGRIAMIYNDYFGGSVTVQYKSSTDGGHNWREYRDALAGPMPITHMANSTQGRMLGEYLGLSIANSSAIAVFPVALTPPSGGGYNQAMYTHTPLGF